MINEKGILDNLKMKYGPLINTVIDEEDEQIGQEVEWSIWDEDAYNLDNTKGWVEKTT